MKRKISFICIFILILSMVMPVNSLAYTYEQELVFPACGQEEGEKISVATINGNNMSVSFRNIKASDGKNYIQRETTVSGNKVDSYTDGLGFLIMYASSTSSFSWPINGSNENYPHFYGSYNGNSFNTSNVFAGGYPSWVTMSSMTAGNNKVTMTGENEFAKVEAVWSVAPDEKDPKVELSITAKKEGYYSFGMFTSPKSIAKTDMKFIQVPFRYNEKGLPDDCYLVSEAYSTASVSQVTTNTGAIIPEKDVTYGVYVDSKSVVSNGNTSASNPRWVKSNSSVWYVNDSFSGERVNISDDESNFGMSIRAKDGGVQPGAFAPIMGTSDSKFSQDGVYKITYRPLATVSEPSISSWYDTYERVLSDYLKVRDYRDNYYASAKLS